MVANHNTRNIYHKQMNNGVKCIAPYCVCFWANPPSHKVWTSFMDALSPVRQQRLRPVVHHAGDERLNAAELRVDPKNLQIRTKMQ